MAPSSAHVQGVRPARIRSRRATSASTASDRSRSPTTTRASTPPRRSARSRRARADIWRYADFLPLSRAPARPAAARADAAGARRPARRAARARGGVDQERRRQPDPLVQGPGRRGGAGEGARARLRDRRLRLDRQPRQRGRRARRGRAGLDSYVFVPADLEEQKLLATGVYGTRLVGVQGSYDDVNRLCTSSPRAAVGVRERQPAPVLRRGLEDDRLRDSSSSSAGSCPTGSSARSPPARCSRRSPAGSTNGSSSAWSRASCRRSTAPRPTAATRSPRRSPTGRRSAEPQRPEHDRQEPRDRRPGGRRLRARAGAADGRLGRVGLRRRDPRRDPAARRDDRHLHRDRRRGDRPRCWRSWPRPGRSRDSERVVAIITGEGLKTLDAVREGFQIAEIEPTLESFEADGVGERRRQAASPARFRGRWRSRSRSRLSCAPPPTARTSSRSTGGTVGEALDAVFAAHADLRERITEDGTLRRFVNVYVSGEDIRFQEGLDTELSDGDEVTILPAVAGGAALAGPSAAAERPGRDPLRRARHASAGADARDPEGAGRDRRHADPLARDPDLRRPGPPPLPAADRLPRRAGRGVRRRPSRLAGAGRDRVRRHRAGHEHGRARRAGRRAAAGGRFCLTYADGVADIDLAAQAALPRASSGRRRR